MSFNRPFSPNRTDIIIYHKSCPDGIASAWPFWRTNKNRYYKKHLTIIGYSHDNRDPPNVFGKNVVLVDFCFNRDIIIEMARYAQHILVLDHHNSTIRNIGNLQLPNLTMILDKDKSAAQIAWDYIYPNVDRPWFIDVIADRDLWQMKLPNTGAITRAMFSLGYYRWNNLEKLYSSDIDEMKNYFINYGTPLYENDKIEMAKICSKAIDAEMKTPSGKTYRVKLVCCTNNVLKSEVGNYLATQNCDFSVMWRYDFIQDSWWISTRASDSSNINLAEICEEFSTGGGHEKASGFALGPGTKLQHVFRHIT